MRQLIKSDETGAGSSVDNLFKALHCSRCSANIGVCFISHFWEGIYGFGVGVRFDSLPRPVKESDSSRIDTNIVVVSGVRCI